MNKWLMVLDQVGYGALCSVVPPTAAGPHPLSVDYVPRTTPVGHATISTGQWPSVHRVQGRIWREVVPRYEHRVSRLPNLYPVVGTVFETLARNSLAYTLRTDPAHQDAMIVAVATKDFIPFLFGAWDTDVSVYPRTTTPVQLGADFVIDVVFDSFTSRGSDAVTRVQARVAALAATLVTSTAGWWVRWIDPLPGVLGDSHVRHAMRWTVPQAWGGSPAMVARHWKAFIDANIVAIDQFYADVAELLVGSAPAAPHRIVLQSTVATDTYGHLHGPGSAPYARALQAGVVRVRSLHGRGWSVLVTSDHGGRATPLWWGMRGRSVAVGTATIQLGPGDLVLEGDHLLGYRQGGPANFECVDASMVPARRVAVAALPAPLISNSFHPDQVPDWVLLPDDNALITDARTLRGGGGSHGACVDPATLSLSGIDGEVPCWILAPTPPAIPLDLRGVARTFRSLR